MMLAVFTHIDWGILFGYMGLVMVIGLLASRRKTDAEGYFLAERSMPTWAVALSIIATSLSVATFTGAPQEAFDGNLTYLSLYLGGFLAVFIVAALFVPRLYRAGTVTIYGYIEQRFGAEAKTATSCMFLFGRLLSSGARLFIAAIPVCLLIYGEPVPTLRHLIIAICLIGIVGIAYTVSGGIRAVIWTDSLQITIVLGAAVVSLILLLHQIPLSIGQIFDVLRHGGPDGVSKLKLFDGRLDTTTPYTLWTALIGNTILTVAVYGTDHDMAQRMLTAKSAWRGSLSLIAAQAMGMIVVMIFLAVGLLLYIFYRRPDIMGAAAPTDPLRASIQVYPQFLLEHMNQMGRGLAGLAMAGMFAAAQGSLDSAINAMASSAVADLYWPLRKWLGLPVDTTSRSPRIAVTVVGLVLVCFAIACAFTYDPKNKTLLQFALGVMAFAYSGMLAVFLTALFTRRGSTASVLAALVTGVIVTTILQDGLYGWWMGKLVGGHHKLSLYWWMPIGTTISFLVCLCGSQPSRRREAAKVIPVDQQPLSPVPTLSPKPLS